MKIVYKIGKEKMSWTAVSINDNILYIKNRSGKPSIAYDKKLPPERYQKFMRL